MALVKWEPLREIEEMFDRYSKAMGWPRANIGQELVSGDWLPKVDIAETDQAFEIKVELPEVNREDIKIGVENGVLSIRGERKKARSSTASSATTAASFAASPCRRMSTQTRSRQPSRMGC
jgi:HSP20 family protein